MVVFSRQPELTSLHPRPGREGGPNRPSKLAHTMRPGNALAVLTAAVCLPSQPAHAAIGLAGESMGWPWGLPFIGILLSIATGPLLFAKIWHRHYGKIAAGWVALTIAPIALVYGPVAALAAVIHAI